MKPLFEAGEEVILQSDIKPENNGNYIIDKIENPDMSPRRITETGETLNCYIYWIDGSARLAAKERSLRKKPKPSEYKFDELIKEINDLVTA